MFGIGSLVKVDASEHKASGMDHRSAGLLVIDEDAPASLGLKQWEVKNSDGESFTVPENALVAL